MYEQVVLNDPMAQAGVCGHRISLILILSLSLRDYYPETARKPVAVTTCSRPSEDDHQCFDEMRSLLLSYLAILAIVIGGEEIYSGVPLSWITMR